MEEKKTKVEPGPLQTKKIKRKAYEAELEKLQAELVAVQEWVKTSGARVVIVFEGRDTAGKGGVIKALTERTSPRVFQTVALPTPTDKEKSQLYFQRYIKHFPAAGEVVVFDRSWYNRAGVERVMGFATEQQVEAFLDAVPGVEKAMVDSGIILLKYWLEVSEQQQIDRIASRIEDPRKYWKLSDMDVASYARWYDYSRARDEMFRHTDTLWAPWYLVDANDQRAARLNVIKHLLTKLPYTPYPEREITLPPRQEPGDYHDPQLEMTWVSSLYDGDSLKS